MAIVIYTAVLLSTLKITLITSLTLYIASKLFNWMHEFIMIDVSIKRIILTAFASSLVTSIGSVIITMSATSQMKALNLAAPTAILLTSLITLAITVISINVFIYTCIKFRNGEATKNIVSNKFLHALPISISTQIPSIITTLYILIRINSL